MLFFNIYKKTVQGAVLGSPALRTDITDGFFKFSLDKREHSIKTETTYADRVYATLSVNDQIWEIYEGTFGDPVLCHRETQACYNAFTDLLIKGHRDIFSLELIDQGRINCDPIGLTIRDGRNLCAKDILEFCNE